MRRRQFILLRTGTALTSATAARARQSGRLRRIGAVMLCPENDPRGQLRARAFRGQLEKAGWTIGNNLQIDFQWGTGDAADKNRSGDLHRLRDPVEEGLVPSLGHPGGNVTGFAMMEPSLGAKPPDMLKQIAPRAGRVVVLLNPDNTTHERILGCEPPLPASPSRSIPPPCAIAPRSKRRCQASATTRRLA